METSCRYINYENTGMFSRLIADYLGDGMFIKDFYAHPTNLAGIAASIEERRKFPMDRSKIVAAFKEAYTHSNPSPKQLENIELLAADNTFTICTAHQPNIFSGYLYFIYKTAHISHCLKSFQLIFPTAGSCRFFILEAKTMILMSSLHSTSTKKSTGGKPTRQVQWAE